MLNITKIDEPKALSDCRKKVKDWKDCKETEKIRKYILEKEQNFQCGYCEKRITSNREKSHIDHFFTRNLFKDKTFDYFNLIISCNSENSCGKKKDKSNLSKNEFFDLVNPILDNPNEHFYFSLTGEIEAKSLKGAKSIKVFNLNHRGLLEIRKQIVFNLKNCKDFSIDELIEAFGGYENLIKESFNA